jgi:hypothetical protein
MLASSIAKLFYSYLMQDDTPFVLPNLSKWQQAKLLNYAEQVLTTQQQMTTAKGKNILHHTLKKHKRHKSFDHYPKGDRIDKQTGAQYFYHCHRENIEHDEHGHFHCFLRYKHIPKHRKPTRLSDWDKYIDNPMTHLIAIAMDRYGQPIRLFTVNRWVTSEIWYDALHLPHFLKRFKMTLDDDPYWQLLDRWVEGMLHLFSPQIAWLHHKRDAIIANHIAQYPDRNVYEDHQIEELSQLSIDLKEQVQWIVTA